MRLLLTLVGCCITLVSLGQTIQQSLRIQITYEKPGQYLDQAIETIEAINTIGVDAVVEYKAGRSITMSPGFETRIGSTFVANIKPVSLGQEGDSYLKLTAYPNPFDHSTTINYYLPTGGKVNLVVVDNQGKLIKQLIQDENQSAGNHQLEWTATDINSGIYIPIIEANQQRATGRLVKK